MPYKDSEHKRQWEREHREQRNARRRKSLSCHSPETSSIVAPLPDPNSAQVALTSKNVAIGGVMGLALIFTVLILIWRLGGSTDPVART